jgi:predicted nucleic acid-binding protein
MQLIVADTTPLNYLVLIDAVEILPKLYGRVLVPPAVQAELAHRSAPDLVRAWITRSPSWLEVVSAERPIGENLWHLDAGEREAIFLACEFHEGLLLMDERDGVSVARRLALRVVGTLSVLDLAAIRGLVDLRVMFDRLRTTTFRSPIQLMSSMLEEDTRRKKG